jgi:hypothetical protein
MPFDQESPDGTAPEAALLADRRVWVRYPGASHADTQVFDTGACASQFARLVNLSSGGVGLLLDEPVPEKTYLKIEVEQHGSFHMLMARVVHVRRMSNGWLHGCEFSRNLSASQLRALLED